MSSSRHSVGVLEGAQTEDAIDSNTILGGQLLIKLRVDHELAFDIQDRVRRAPGIIETCWFQNQEWNVQLTFSFQSSFDFERWAKEHLSLVAYPEIFEFMVPGIPAYSSRVLYPECDR